MRHIHRHRPTSLLALPAAAGALCPPPGAMRRKNPSKAGLYCLSVGAAALLLCTRPAQAQVEFYVTNATGSVSQVTATGTASTFTTSGLTGAVGLGFDAAGDLYVGDFNANTIVKYTATGGVLSSTGTTFSSNGLNHPFGMAFDAAGDLFVANYANQTTPGIEKYTATGGVLSSTGTTFVSSGLTGPWGVAFDAAGDLFVADEAGDKIVKYTSTGGVLSSTGTTFSSGLNRPSGLAFDAAGDLFAAINNSNTIEEYTATGGVLSSTGTAFSISGLNMPRGLAFDTAGDLYAANFGNSTIEKFTSTGGVLSNIGTTFTSSGLSSPEYLALAVPEPGSAVLMVTGGLGLLLRRRRNSAGVFALLLLAVGLCVGPTRGRAQTLLNGSFESPVLPANSSQNDTGGDNWTFSGPTSPSTSLFTNSFGAGTTPFGEQWLALNYTGSSDAQTISSGFTLNAPYTLSLVAADLVGDDGDNLTIDISGGATASQTFAIPARPGGESSDPLPFVTYALAFTPTTSDPVTVTLTNTSTGSGFVAVDNVAVNNVPEPSVWMSIVGGLGMLAGFQRFGRKRAA